MCRPSLVHRKPIRQLREVTRDHGVEGVGEYPAGEKPPSQEIECQQERHYFGRPRNESAYEVVAAGTWKSTVVEIYGWWVGYVSQEEHPHGGEQQGICGHEEVGVAEGKLRRTLKPRSGRLPAPCIRHLHRSQTLRDRCHNRARGPGTFVPQARRFIAVPGAAGVPGFPAVPIHGEPRILITSRGGIVSLRPRRGPTVRHERGLGSWTRGRAAEARAWPTHVRGNVASTRSR